MAVVDDPPVVDELATAMKKAHVDKDEAATKAKEHGFVEPEAYDYKAYNQHAEAALENKEPIWLAEAVRYEWEDEYGDVGPRIEALEKQLFHDENRMKAGANIHAYEIEVTLEGPERVMPFLTVSFPSAYSPYPHAYTDGTLRPVRRCGPAPNHARERQALWLRTSHPYSIVHYSYDFDGLRCRRLCPDWVWQDCGVPDSHSLQADG